MNWYYAQGDQRQGPVSDSELDALLAAGTINENTLVWQEGMANWTPLKDARPPSASGTADNPPPGWIRCTATGRYFPPEQIVYLDGKPYSAEAKPAVLQGVMQGGILPSTTFDRDGPPWEKRAELGFFPATWETVKTVLIQPGETFDRMKREGGLGNPLLFNVIVGSVGGIIGLIYQLVFNSGMQALIPQANRDQTASTAFLVGFTLGMAIAMPIILAITAFISAGITHLSLMICGGAKQSFETTFRTYCYVSGASSLLQIIPICGAYISGIWGLVCMCIGISRTHEIGVGRAVVAVLLPTVVCCVLVVFAVFAVMGAVFASQGLQAPQ